MGIDEIPDLSFPRVTFGSKETPWNLRPLLYVGGAGAHVKDATHLIGSGQLGMPLSPRIAVVVKIHEDIEACLVGGGSRNTAATNIRRIRELYSWADLHGKSLSIETLETDFLSWTDHLAYRARTLKLISRLHAYQCAVAVGKIIEFVLGQAKGGLIKRSRIRRPTNSKTSIGRDSERQNLAITFEFGHALLDLSESLSTDAIKGPLPAILQFRNGKIIEEWTKLRPPDSLRTLSAKARPSTIACALAKRAAWDADSSFRTRHPLINLRIEAEMLLFIAQTGMNLEQVHLLNVSKFRFSSHLDGYQVYRVYKGRRHGEVVFEIFSEYRIIFERYLHWRETLFPDNKDGLLFPLIRKVRIVERVPSFNMVIKVCRNLGISFVCPRKLRKTRINWMLRRSGDPELTAEMHAHSSETLLRSYEQPSLQVAIVELNSFHSKNDPFLAPPGPGNCVRGENESPSATTAPTEAPESDCVSPSGCLFCDHNRDIDSSDHVWSLTSFRHLKSLELARYRPTGRRKLPHPALASIDRINTKLKAFEGSSDVRRLWVGEALQRTEEDYHHPRWDGFIQLMEVGP